MRAAGKNVIKGTLVVKTDNSDTVGPTVLASAGQEQIESQTD
jgi:hypothetical protein